MPKIKGLIIQCLNALVLLTLVGCHGDDRSQCLFGTYQPEFEITVYNAATGDELCGTAYIGGFASWAYTGNCKYVFEKVGSNKTTNITASLEDYKTYTEVNVKDPNSCSSGPTIVNMFLEASP